MAYSKKVKLEAETVITRMITFEKALRWRIENFFDWLDAAKKVEKSTIFEINLGNLKDPYYFCFTLFPRGLNDEAAGHVSLYLNNCSKEDVRIDYKLYIEGKNDSYKEVCSGEKTRIEKNNACGRSKAINISVMKECEEYREFLTIGCLVTITLPEVISSAVVEDPVFEENVSAQETLTDNFSNALFNLAHSEQNTNDFARLSDIKIRCCNEVDVEKSFKCHKIILALRSPVFAAMLFRDYTESQRNLVIVHDVSPDTMETLLHFVYTDQVKEDAIDFKLLVAADKYQILRLKAICEKVLVRKMTASNAIKVAITAYLQGSNVFQQRAVKYLANHWEEIRETDGSEEIKMYPELLYTLLSLL